MQRLQAFKFAVDADPNRVSKMSQFAGCRRVVYNKGLDLQQANYATGGKFLSYETIAKNLGVWRKDAASLWLNEAPYHVLQQALKDLDRAFRNFFAKRSAFPARKKKGRCDSFRYPDPKQIKLDQQNSRIFLPKLGWVRYRNSREVLGTVKNVTVSKSNGRWFVSIQTVREVEPSVPQGDPVGIDLGIVRLATLSDGTVVPPLGIYKRFLSELRKAQQSMSRKKKFSSNWKKAKARVQRIHARIANARRDCLHKATTAISKSHAMVALEDLQVSNMSRSASGTVEQPGNNVRQKAGLNRSILDQGWGEFRTEIEYKMNWAGGIVVAVPPMNTSRTCPCCGHISGDNRRSQATFACVKCGYRENADLVAAINILRVGHTRLACEVNGEVSRQQQELAKAAA